jgi:RNA polymerase sigma-70 factor (ECF subfamily)
MGIDEIIANAYEVHGAAIRGKALQLTRDPEVAADVTQEAFLRLFVEAKAGRLPDNVQAWLYRTSANLVISRSRRSEVARRYAPHLLSADRPVQPDEIVLRNEESQLLTSAVGTLPVADRIALVMAARGATGLEIAAELGRSHVATRALLSRARGRLRSGLAEAWTLNAA